MVGFLDAPLLFELLDVGVPFWCANLIKLLVDAFLSRGKRLRGDSIGNRAAGEWNCYCESHDRDSMGEISFQNYAFRGCSQSSGAVDTRLYKDKEIGNDWQ